MTQFLCDTNTVSFTHCYRLFKMPDKAEGSYCATMHFFCQQKMHDDSSPWLDVCPHSWRSVVNWSTVVIN